MRRIPIVWLTVFASVLTACASASASGTPSTSGPQSPGGSVRVVTVTMTDQLRFEPDVFTFSAGETVRFEVANAGAIQHEFFVGDAAAQAAHEEEMVEMGGMTHDEPNGVSVDPGQTQVLDHAFVTPGEILIGCHEPGHYAGGMVATVTVKAD